MTERLATERRIIDVTPSGRPGSAKVTRSQVRLDAAAVFEGRQLVEHEGEYLRMSGELHPAGFPLRLAAAAEVFGGQ
ncbi:hypothetical protein [Saccharopolyspora pogona]|uniref:hypothetical protein n=1 Tax=Saccharopolyspora pogona TaxID=333966 RepID=UPI001687A3C4|nr:hypothetical protein [Saccharopolyspora pogona]